jgi:hypothetical protein
MELFLFIFMQQQRLFGEMPTLAFNTVLPLQVLPEGGVATIVCFTDCVFPILNFRYPVAASQSLATLTIPAGTTIYGVQSYSVSAGIGQAFHSTV